jgi:hypothetical protein
LGKIFASLTVPLQNFATVDQLIDITISPDAGLDESGRALVLLMEYEFADYKSKSLDA